MSTKHCVAYDYVMTMRAAAAQLCNTCADMYAAARPFLAFCTHQCIRSLEHCAVVCPAGARVLAVCKNLREIIFVIFWRFNFQ